MRAEAIKASLRRARQNKLAARCEIKGNLALTVRAIKNKETGGHKTNSCQ